MDKWGIIYELIISDSMFSVVLSFCLLLIGYCCMNVSKNCTYAYYIGRSRDAAAGRFALISLMLYVSAGVILLSLGINAMSSESKKPHWDIYSEQDQFENDEFVWNMLE